MSFWTKKNSCISQTRYWNVLVIFGGWLSKIRGHVQWVFLVIFILSVSACYWRVISGELWVRRFTGGRVSQHAAKQTHGFSYQQLERNIFPVQVVAAEWERGSLLCQCLLGMLSYYYLSEVSENCYTFGCILFILFFLTRTS